MKNARAVTMEFLEDCQKRCDENPVFRTLSCAVSKADLADAATELFNVLCGHVVVELYQATHLKIRFQIPQFSPGYSIPENRMHLFTLNYRSNKDESIQVIHHIPLSLCKTGGEHLERRYMT